MQKWRVINSPKEEEVSVAWGEGAEKFTIIPRITRCQAFAVVVARNDVVLDVAVIPIAL